MDETIIVNPGEIVLVKVNNSQGFYAYVVDIVADSKPGWWQIKLSALIPTPDFELRELNWKLDDSQIRGAEFTMNTILHQLCKVSLPKPTPIKNDKRKEKRKRELPSYIKVIK